MVTVKQIIALIERFEHKLELLQNRYADAKRQVKELEAKKADLQKKLKIEQDLVTELRKKTDNSEKNTLKSKDGGIIVEDNLSEINTNAQLKQQLDEYIRELERCIAHLSSLS